jgi:hypothetical protein
MEARRLPWIEPSQEPEHPDRSERPEGDNSGGKLDMPRLVRCISGIRTALNHCVGNALSLGERAKIGSVLEVAERVQADLPDDGMPRLEALDALHDAAAGACDVLRYWTFTPDMTPLERAIEISEGFDRLAERVFRGYFPIDAGEKPTKPQERTA